MRYLIFLLVAMLTLGMTTMAVADDCPSDKCPLQVQNTVDAPGDIVEVLAVGVLVRHPVAGVLQIIEKRNKAASSRKPTRKIVKGLTSRKRGRSAVKRVLKLPRALRICSR